MIKRVHHIAIAVNNLDEALATYEKFFGFKPSKVKTVAEQKVRAALLPVGDGELEIIQPIDPNSGVAKFLQTRGEGIHHICFEVDDINKELENMASRGVELIDKKGRSGLAGTIGFLSPKSTKGVLIELAQTHEHE